MREYAALIVIGSWLVFAPVLIVRLPGLFGHTTRRNFGSILGVLLVGFGFVFAWPPRTTTTTTASPHVILGLPTVTPPLALAPRAGAALAVGSSALGLWAILMLGRQWSVQARLREDHQLVTAGPYRWVRHPVYSAFFGLLIATGLVFATTPSHLIIGVLLYLTGTAFRMRSEDALLRERFGKTFDDYARRTPALLPFSRGRSSPPQNL